MYLSELCCVKWMSRSSVNTRISYLGGRSSGSRAGWLVTRRLLVWSLVPSSSSVKSTWARRLTLTCWLSPCVVYSAVNVWIHSYKLLWVKAKSPDCKCDWCEPGGQPSAVSVRSLRRPAALRPVRHAGRRAVLRGFWAGPGRQHRSEVLAVLAFLPSL